MMNDSNGKTLLLLGGAAFQVVAIEAAKKLGYRTVLCDYLPDNPGQFAADVFYQVSTTDVEAVLDVARKEHVDGVLSFGSDVAAPTAAKVAAALGLPGNPPEAVETLSEKHLFRSFLKEHNLPSPESLTVTTDANPHDVLTQLASFKKPIMVKPTDSSGSKGITTLYEVELEGLTQALAHAAEYSRNKTLIVEERISDDRPLIIGGDIFVVNGTICFWGLMRALRDYRLSGLVPVGEAFPAGLSQQAEQHARQILQAIVSGLGIRFGEMNVEIIIDHNDTPYVIELAARAGGNFLPTQLSDVSGIDLIDANVLCAMGDDPGDTAFSSGGKNVFTYVLHTAKGGKLADVSYAKELSEHLYREIRYAVPGDQVTGFVNATNAIGISFFEYNRYEDMVQAINSIEESVTVTVAE